VIAAFPHLRRAQGEVEEVGEVALGVGVIFGIYGNN